MEQLKQLSKIDGDVAVIVASYASPIKDQVYSHFVRNKPVCKLTHWTKDEKGHTFQLVVFADHTQQWVNVANIRSFKQHRFAGGNK